jgi:hypothetical protein
MDADDTKTWWIVLGSSWNYLGHKAISFQFYVIILLLNNISASHEDGQVMLIGIEVNRLSNMRELLFLYLVSFTIIKVELLD